MKYNANPNKWIIQQANLNVLNSVFNSCSGSVGSSISCSGSLSAYSRSWGYANVDTGVRSCHASDDGSIICW